MAQTASTGDTVRVHYTGTLADGTVFDSSRQREPLQFTLGKGGILPAFEAAVTGLAVGASTQTQIDAADAYGPRHDDRVFEVPRTDLPAGMDPQVGQQLQMQAEGQESMVVTVSASSDDSITIDANHPLAGQDLSFAIELVAIV